MPGGNPIKTFCPIKDVIKFIDSPLSLLWLYLILILYYSVLLTLKLTHHELKTYIGLQKSLIGLPSKGWYKLCGALPISSKRASLRFMILKLRQQEGKYK